MGAMTQETDDGITTAEPAGIALLNEAIEGLQMLHGQSPGDHVFFVAEPSNALLQKLVPTRTLAVFKHATAGSQLFLAAIAPEKVAGVLAGAFQPASVEALAADLLTPVAPSDRHVALLLDDGISCVVVEFGPRDPGAAQAQVLFGLDDFGCGEDGERTIALGGALKLMYNRPLDEMTERGRLHALWVQERGRAALELEATRAEPREAGVVLIEACGGPALRTAWAGGLESFVAYLDVESARAAEQPQ